MSPLLPESITRSFRGNQKIVRHREVADNYLLSFLFYQLLNLWQHLLSGVGRFKASHHPTLTVY